MALIGHVNQDRILLPDGTNRKGYGGALYTAAALATLFEGKARIELFTDLSVEETPRLEELLREWGHDFVLRTSRESGGSNQAEIVYDDSGGRTEKTWIRSRSVTAEVLKAASEADLVLVNFVSGTDLDLAEFENMKRNRKGLLLVDLHCLNRPVGEDGMRHRRTIPRWQELVNGIDLLQGNAEELADLVGEKLGPPITAGYLPPVWRQTLGEILKEGVRCVVMTLGASGAWLAYALAAGRGRFIWQPAFSVTPVDPTGCGDTFTAGLAYGLWTLGQGKGKAMRAFLARSEKMRSVMRWGAAAAAVKAEHRGPLPPNAKAVRRLVEGASVGFDSPEVLR